MIYYEYTLSLNNGEELEFCELDEVTVLELKNTIIKNNISFILDKCSNIPRFAIEEAKCGTTTNFQQFLKTPPKGILIKLSLLCSEVKTCPMANLEKCKTGHLNQKSQSDFPVCWTADIKSHCLSETEHHKALNLVNKIINMWKENKYVIIPRD